MDCAVVHPYGQLELDLPGVAPLSARACLERLVAAPLDGSGIEQATLEIHLLDEQSREGRAYRLNWLREMREPYVTAWGWVMPGGVESLWLYHEASQCFVLGQYAASVLCAHACCERVLAGYLHLGDDLDGRLARAGLGPVAAAAHESGLISDSLHERLVEINAIRKVVAHFKPPFEPFSVHMRLTGPWDSDDALEDAVDERLAADAQASLVAATEVVRGIGFNRADRTQPLP